MKKNWQHITHNGHCPSIDKLQLYYKGVLSKEENFVIENHIAGCEICSDLLDGISELKDTGSLVGIESELKQRIYENLVKNKPKRKIIPLYQKIAVAASILLIIGISVIIYHINEKPFKPVAQNIPEKISSSKEKTEVKKEQKENFAPVLKREEKKKSQVPVSAKINPISTVTMSHIHYDDESKKAGNVQCSKVKTRDTIVESSPIAMSADNSLSERSELKQIKTEDLKDKGAKIEYYKDQIASGKYISGKVTDENGVTLQGVNIIIKGTTKGTVTDLNGRFTIEHDNPNDVLSISYVGYKNQELAVLNKQDISITLQEEVTALNEVVVVGYGVQKKSIVTGSSSSINAKNRKVEEALQGKATGVTITNENVELNDSLKADLKANNYSRKDIIKLAEECLEHQKKQEALDKLYELLTLTNNATEKKETEEIIKYTRDGKYNKALKKLERLK